jgi:hypothetical protein
MGMPAPHAISGFGPYTCSTHSSSLHTAPRGHVAVLHAPDLPHPLALANTALLTQSQSNPSKHSSALTRAAPGVLPHTHFSLHVEFFPQTHASPQPQSLLQQHFSPASPWAIVAIYALMAVSQAA